CASTQRPPNPPSTQLSGNGFGQERSASNLVCAAAGNAIATATAPMAKERMRCILLLLHSALTGSSPIAFLRLSNGTGRVLWVGAIVFTLSPSIVTLR